MEQYIVRIKEYETDKVVESMKPTSLRNANKLYDSVEVNLNHEEYYVEVVPYVLTQV